MNEMSGIYGMLATVQADLLIHHSTVREVQAMLEDTNSSIETAMTSLHDAIAYYKPKKEE